MSQNLPELLLFEDEPRNGQIVKDRLSENFKVELCANKEELENVIEYDRFCVIACDVNIQDSDDSGYEIMAQLRTEFKVIGTPIVVYSGNRDISVIKNTEGTGFEAYVDKSQANWGVKLKNACLTACAKTGRLVSADVYEKILKGHLDDQIDVSKLSDEAEFFEVRGGDGLTIRQILETLRKKELDKDTERVYIQALKKYNALLKSRQ
tara:strand:+ start:75 stop:698 length:624 start_codon:yes stop_codon:yes gene_type:complete